MGERRDTQDDGVLVRSAADGDLSAFDQLVTRYQRRANAVAYRLLNNVDDAMETVQDAFVRAYENLGTLSDPDRFGAWLMRIVSNQALNRRRARALRRAASLDAGGADEGAERRIDVADTRGVSPLDAAAADELKQRLDDAIAQLPPLQREAIVMFCIAKMPQREIARELGCSVQAVKWHVFDGRRKLKELLADYL